MKRCIFYIITAFLAILFLTGCAPSREKTEKIYEALKKYDVVESDYKFVGIEYSYKDGLFSTLNTYYIYKNGDNYIAIEYTGSSNENRQKGYKYEALLYDDVTLNAEKQEVIPKEEAQKNSLYYHFRDAKAKDDSEDEYYLISRYVKKEPKKYLVKEKRTLFGIKYEIDEE